MKKLKSVTITNKNGIAFLIEKYSDNSIKKIIIKSKYKKILASILTTISCDL